MKLLREEFERLTADEQSDYLAGRSADDASVFAEVDEAAPAEPSPPELIASVPAAPPETPSPPPSADAIEHQRIEATISRERRMVELRARSRGASMAGGGFNRCRTAGFRVAIRLV